MIQRFRGIIEESKWHKKRIEEMIRYSSNPSTNTIIHLAGYASVAESMVKKNILSK